MASPTPSPPLSPFFIGEDRRDGRRPSVSSPNVSRPSSAGTNPFSSPTNSDFSRIPASGEIESVRVGVSIALPTDIPRSPPYSATSTRFAAQVSQQFTSVSHSQVSQSQYTQVSHSHSQVSRSQSQLQLTSRSSSGIRVREALAAPPSRPLTAHSTLPSLSLKKATRMRSTLLEDSSTIEKPWAEKKDPYARISYYLTYGVAFLGIVASALRCYFGYKSVPVMKGNLCMVLDEEFDTDTNTVFGSGKWFHEVELGGFGNGEFEMTTSSTNNSYVQNGYLYITPTLTSDAIGMDNVLNGYTYNLTDCTYNTTNPEALPGGGVSNTTFDSTAYSQACGAVSNSSTGAVINPVQSARISTRNSASIRYGRVEVKAKLPRGDWLWPAIWMLPVNNTYGPWPLSGEIDIMESRGNARSYHNHGIDYVQGTLNWGPLSFLNAFYKTFGWWTQRRTDYGDMFHTYVLEWTESFLRIYVDSRLHYMLQLDFNEPFFTRGNFPPVVENGSTPIVLENPWVNGTNATPFDQPFYLILDLAVGGTNGWFLDNVGGKPWLDGSNTAMRSFIEAKDQWYPTWQTNGQSNSFIIDYVKMWQLC